MTFKERPGKQRGKGQSGRAKVNSMGKHLRQERFWLIHETKEGQRVERSEGGGAWGENGEQQGLLSLGSVARATCLHLNKIAMGHKNVGAMVICGCGRG